MLVNTAANDIDPRCFVKAAVLVTRPGEAPALEWIVDTSLHGPELTAFHQSALGGLGTLIEHGPVRGAPRGFTELSVAVTDVPRDVIEQLPRRLRAAVMTSRTAQGKD